jgi:hypothetical protein
MTSSWITTRTTKHGGKRYPSSIHPAAARPVRYGGSFRTRGGGALAGVPCRHQRENPSDAPLGRPRDASTARLNREARTRGVRSVRRCNAP